MSQSVRTPIFNPAGVLADNQKSLAGVVRLMSMFVCCTCGCIKKEEGEDRNTRKTEKMYELAEGKKRQKRE